MASSVASRLEIVLEGLEDAPESVVREAVQRAIRDAGGVERRVGADGRVERVVRVRRPAEARDAAVAPAMTDASRTVDRVSDRLDRAAAASRTSVSVAPTPHRFRRNRTFAPESTLLSAFEVFVDGPGPEQGLQSSAVVPMGASARALARQVGGVPGVRREIGRPTRRPSVRVGRQQEGTLISSLLEGSYAGPAGAPARDAVQGRLQGRLGEGPSRTRWSSPVVGAELLETGEAPGFAAEGEQSESPAERAAARLSPRRAPTGTRARPFSNMESPAGPAPRAARDRRGRPSRRRRPNAPQATYAMPATAQAPVEDEADVPVWARRERGRSRAGGRDRLIGERESFRADHPVVNALARAASPDEIVRLVSDGTVTQAQLKQALPSPAVRLVERIITLERTAQKERREQDRHVMGLRMRGTGPTPDFVKPSGGARTSTSSAGPRQFLPVATASAASGMQANRVTQLANKLLNLIHLAEVDQRVKDAQAQVRMSDSDPGGGEGGGGGGEGGGAEGKSDSIKALAREVKDQVVKQIQELNIRTEDPDGHSKWW